MGLSSSVTPLGGSSSVTPLAASSEAPPVILLKLPVESRLPRARLPACLRNGARAGIPLDCSTGVPGVDDVAAAAGAAAGTAAGTVTVIGSGSASMSPLVTGSSALGLSGLPGTSRDPRCVPDRRVSVGELVLTGKRVWLRSRRCDPLPRLLGPGDTPRGERCAAIARWRSSMLARRLLSSVEMARGR
jgi:hypothetical protein